MAKVQFNCRISEEVQALINSETERLTLETGKKVSQADVVELAVVRWCSEEGASPPSSEVMIGGEIGAVADRRRAVAEAAIRDAETRPTEIAPSPKISGRAESVAQRKARETREQAAALAESDTTARLMGRDDIEYDLEDVRHRQTGVGVPPKSTERHHYPVADRKVAPITRPHGHTDSKKRHTS